MLMRNQFRISQNSTLLIDRLNNLSFPSLVTSIPSYGTMHKNGTVGCNEGKLGLGRTKWGVPLAVDYELAFLLSFQWFNATGLLFLWVLASTEFNDKTISYLAYLV